MNDEIDLDLDNVVEQRLHFHLVDGTIWSITVDVGNLAEILEAYRDVTTETIHIHGNAVDNELNWYFLRRNIVAIAVINLEDVEVENETGGSLSPPKKSRRRAS